MTNPSPTEARLNVNIDRALHSKFKAAASMEGKRMTDILIEYIKRYVGERESELPRKGGKR